MWRIPLSLIAGGSDVTLEFTSDILIGDLYTYVGSPSSPKDYTISADNCNVGNVIITSSFPAGSTFQFIATNGGRFIGLGGDGGKGGDDFGTSGSQGIAGGDGGPAITSAFDVNINIDNGFLLGGGGGGGGGSYSSASAGAPGGGGGGGAGFSPTSGGVFGSGTPAAQSGGDGSITGPGVGGAGGVSGVEGGDGGDFGWGGVSGGSSNIIGGPVGFYLYYGGLGGRAGEAFLSTGGSATFNGAKSEATLRSEDRLKGESSTPYLNGKTLQAKETSDAGNGDLGFSFENDGDLEATDSHIGGITESISSQWLKTTGTNFGDDYEIRFTDVDGTWNQTLGTTIDTWVSLASTRNMTKQCNGASPESAAAHIEIRRSDANATADQVMTSLYIRVRDENGV